MTCRRRQCPASAPDSVPRARRNHEVLAWFEGEGEVGRGYLVGAAQPGGGAGAVLAMQAARPGLLAEVGRQVSSAHDGLEIVSDQDAAGRAAGAVEVHDAALEALVDEVGVVRIGGG